jgi:DNA-damage-inducible protein J
MKGVFAMGATKSVNMNIRMDETTKKQAQQLFAEFGLDMTTAINMFLKQSVREQKIPFELKVHVPNSETIEAIKEIEEMKKSGNFGKTYKDIDKMFEELLA